MVEPPTSAPDLQGGWLSSVAAGIDGLVLGAARIVIDLAVMPPPERADDLRSSAAYYLQPEFAADPRRFFSFLDGPARMPEVTLAQERPPVSWCERLALSFPSGYEPMHPDQRHAHGLQVENHTARAEIWIHPPGRRRGTVIGLHGFGTGYPSIDSTALMATAFYWMGLDVVLFTLPFHGRRRPVDTRFSGQLFASPSVMQINEAIGQSVYDLVALVAWLRENTEGPVGLVGLSLGGYVAALMTGLVDDLDFVVPIVAPACFGDLAYRFMSTSRRYRDRPDARLTRDEFREAYRVHSPLTYERRVPRERVMIVAGAGDRVVPSEHPTMLWEHWGRPAIHWFSGSHLAPFGRRRTQNAVGRFLHDLDIV